MIRITTMIVLAVFLPMQLYAADLGGFGTDTQVEYFVPRVPDKPQERHDQQLTEKILENPPKAAETKSSGTNWWLWGGLGLAAAAGVVAALAGGKGGGSPAASSTGSSAVAW